VNAGQVARWVRTVDDVLSLLDGMFAPDADRWTDGGAGWWDEFYGDRSRPVPFFAPVPDENLVWYLERGLLARGRALDLGCGPGRNAIWLARQDFDVDAVDVSPAAVAWATERAREAAVDVRFHRGDVFSVALPPGRYDLVYDSGCLHHLPPHRRISYLALLDRVLAPGGHLGLTCFAVGAMGCEVPDEQLYLDGRLHGGLAYTPDALRSIFRDFEEMQVRPMRELPPESPAFGASFLLTALFRRPPCRPA
jgi:SAM-dependent methyltransferase